MSTDMKKGMGFIVVIILLAVFTISLAVVGREFVTKKLRTEARLTTEEKLATLKTILIKYYADNDQFPTSLLDLETNPGLTTWRGPYSIDGFENNDYSRDGWRGNFSYNTTAGAWGADPCTLYSFGPNGQDDLGAGDDIVVNPGTTNPTQIEPANIQWETIRSIRKNLALINAAGADYGSYPVITTLNSADYVSADCCYDSWGTIYNTDGAQYYSSGPDGVDDNKLNDDITATTP